MAINLSKEKIFVSSFVRKEFQERLLFELNSKSKRQHSMGRFCHDTEKLIKANTIYLESTKLDNGSIQKIIDQLVPGNSTCYVMSYYFELDTTETTFENALSRCIGAGMPSVILVNSKTAVIETEQCFGATTKYILNCSN